ncbi:MAG: OmpA family protein [Gammaproteobacteria bacterium]|nr:OmpA family protein [Gammaproteobacteria bacterium]
MNKTLPGLIIGLSLIGSLHATPVDGDQHCDHTGNRCQLPEESGKSIANSRVRPQALPANSETVTDHALESGACMAADTGIAPAFRVSVDGEPTAETDPRNAADAQRCTDIALARADIQIRYDGGEQTPWLNAHATPHRATLGKPVQFMAYSNYAAWVKRAEVRIFTGDTSTQQTPVAVVPVELGEAAAWTPPLEGSASYRYLLRVYDAQGHFDETQAKPLAVTRTDYTDASAVKAEQGDPLLAGYGENSLALHNIPVRGAAVTASGTGLRAGDTVHFMDMPVPVDAEGRFAVRQILPVGPHNVDVRVRNVQGGESRFTRNISIADDQWFYVGLADLTLGRNDTSGPAQLVTVDDSDHYADKVYVDGRLAFYLKGKIKGKYLLTAAADTREQPIEDLFSNFSSKDPRYLLRRLDAERYYPVYGDDSTTIEDAPTQGKFYVKLERGDSQVMWGNFQTSITGSDLVQYNRGLYGARVKLVSEDATGFGERRGIFEGFIADPGSLPGRDEFRGTGGSLYYLQRQDVTLGSERVWIEVRDHDSGLVLETRYLAPAQDYDVNYLQGRILLREPLGSTADSSTLVRTGSLSGHPAFLVVSYEYTPGLTETDDLVNGGRAQFWANDHVGIGLTGYRQEGVGMEQTLKGADLTLRSTPGTYLKLETANSDGTGSGSNLSRDGGFNFNGAASPGGDADANRVEAGVDFSELKADAKGRGKVYWQDREAGFSAPGQITGSEGITQQGAAVDWNVTDATALNLKADELDAGTRSTTAAEVNVRQHLTENWAVAAGVRNDDRTLSVQTASPTLNEEGQRTDVILKGEYRPDAPVKDEPDWSVYSFIQNTVDKDATRSDNDRLGIGGARQINKRFALTGEISGGDGGLGALASGNYTLDDQSSLYLNYELDTDRTDTGYRGRQGRLTSGGRTRFSDSVSVYGEERFLHGEGPSGLTHAYGVDLAPNDRWTYGVKLEAGELADPLAGDMKRRAAGLSMGYHHDAVKYAGNLEYRREEATAGDRRTWLLRNTLGYQINPDWRYLGRLNLSVSESSQGNFYDGDYVEFVSGYAFRPVDHNRLNALLKYTYFYTLPPPNQLTGNDKLADYAQRSHVLSADAIYDLRPWLSVGGKYGLRLGELKDTRVGGQWQDSLAHLYVLRADLHWTHEWDLLLEGRMLDVRAAQDRHFGALVGVYRHLNDNVKIGVGYNFTDFSDDLTDLSYDNRGWFVNLIGKI